MVYIIDNKATYVPANSRSNLIMKRKSPITVIWDRKRKLKKTTNGTTTTTKLSGGELFVEQFKVLFALSKLMGLYPYEWKAFMREKKFKKSTFGIICVLMAFIIITLLYVRLVLTLNENYGGNNKANQSTLTFIISKFLTYATICMMLTDQMNGIYNQRRMNVLFERISNLDVKFNGENVFFNNACIRKRINCMILITVVFELVFVVNSLLFLHEEFRWDNLFWCFCCLPTFFNSLDKIWFAASLWGLRLRFAAINTAINNLIIANANDNNNKDNVQNYENNRVISATKTKEWDFFRKEFSMHFTAMKKNRVSPQWMNNRHHGHYNFPVQFIESSLNSKNSLDQNYDDVEYKLNILCQQHDELCEIGKYINSLWSYPILILMAYGFLMFTSHLYFHYCATQNQEIPVIFLTAKSIFVTATILMYAGSKCIYLLYLTWITSLECKRTGIFLHKYSVAANNNFFYNMVNHLSLKLLNHSVDFTACGFFALNMETLLGVVGGITSYLIILIQFNLAAQQAKNYFFSTNGVLGNSNNDSSLLTSLLNYSTTLMPTTAFNVITN